MNNIRLTFFVMVIVSALAVESYSQPYLNLFSAVAWNMPAESSSGTPRESYWFVNASVPVNASGHDLVLFSPFSDRRTFHDFINEENMELDGNGILVSWVHFSPDSSRSLTFAGLIQNYSDGYKFNSNTWQLGGVILYGLSVNEKLIIQPGLYYNGEFFGAYFLPVANVDWRPDSNWRLFGLLPRLAVVERKLSNSWYTGMRFRGITTSYRLSDNNEAYVKYEDRQLFAFLDKYLAKYIVLSLQGGISVSRNVNARNVELIPDFEFHNASPLIRAGIYFRFRTDN